MLRRLTNPNTTLLQFCQKALAKSVEEKEEEQAKKEEEANSKGESVQNNNPETPKNDTLATYESLHRYLETNGQLNFHIRENVPKNGEKESTQIGVISSNGVEQGEAPAKEKVKPTLQNLYDLYGVFVEYSQKMKSVYGPHASARMQALREQMDNISKTYIETNNLDVSYENLKLFFADEMDKAPSHWGLLGDLNNYLQNGYDPNKTKSVDLQRQKQSLQNEAKKVRAQYAKYEDFDGVQGGVKNNTEGIDDVSGETPSSDKTTGADEVKGEAPAKEKVKPTLQNLYDLYGVFVEYSQKMKSVYGPHASARIQALREQMDNISKAYIETNNLDVSYENLKLFFADEMDKAPSHWGLLGDLNNYLQNGYDPNKTKSVDLQRQKQSLQNEAKKVRAQYAKYEDFDGVQGGVKNNTEGTDDVSGETPSSDKTTGTDEVKGDAPAKEKVKPTLQNMKEMYDLYRKFVAVSQLKDVDIGITPEEVEQELQDYIKTNNLDVSYENLKLFFADVMKKSPNPSELMRYLNDYLQNGYEPKQTPDVDLKEIQKKIEEADKIFKDVFGDAFASDETTGTDEAKGDAPAKEKVKPTFQNMKEMYDLYRKFVAVSQLKENPNFADISITPEDVEQELQNYIKTNNLDVSYENLKLFFADVMKKSPNPSELMRYLSDYLQNGYEPKQTPDVDLKEIQKKIEEADKIFKEVFGDAFASDETTGTDEAKGDAPASDKTTNSSTKNVTKLYEEIIPKKIQLRNYVSSIMANDDDVDPSGINQYGYFRERELDTFVDAMISKVVKESNTQDVNKLLDEIKNAIKKELSNDPYAPMNINKYLVMTDDYLLSEEEKQLKADLLDVEFDTDPTEIDGSGFDYSVMPQANVKVADMTADWDVSDIDSALNCKNPLTGNYSKKSSTLTLYKNLERLKPQLKAYIKEQLVAQGLEYNEKTVEKYLNYYITETVREAIQAKYHEKLPNLYPNTVLSADATLKDLGEYLITKVKDELAEGDKAFGTTWSTSGFDPLINSTSDYFLTRAEVKQKQQMDEKKSGI